MTVRCDLHVHTENSFDSRNTLAQIVQGAKKAGIDFVALTDHDKSPAEEVFQNPERDGVTLIPGIELSTDRGHLLGLFLQKPCSPLLDKNGRISFADGVRLIHDCGGLAILAHPFQSTAQTVNERSSALGELEEQLDGLEVMNRRATSKRRDANLLAGQAATMFSKFCIRTAGSDAHLPEEIGTAYLTIECAEKSVSALREALYTRGDGAFTGLPCHRRYIAQSQKIKLDKLGGSPKSWLRWTAFSAVCCLRDLREKKG